MSKSTQDLINQANANLPDNNSGEISAQDVREQHIDVANSSYNKISDSHLIGLKVHNPSIEYKIGDSTIEGGFIWEATADNTGAFNSADWQQLGTTGSPYQLLIDALNANGLSVSGTNPQTLSLILSTASNAGALSASDWVAFNDKQTALGFTPINVLEKGSNDGVATLDSVGKLTSSQLPDAITGALSYMGQWNPNTNTPSVSDGSGSKGEYYVANSDGTINLGAGSIQLFKGDWIIHDGSKFEKLDNTLGAKWGQVIGNINNQTDLITELSKYLQDAPLDGNQYARQSGGWAKVVGGGGGGSYLFGNGITENGGVVKLGGQLTEVTTIDGNNNAHAVQIVNLATFVVSTQFDTLSLSGGFRHTYDDNGIDTSSININPGGINLNAASSNGADTVRITMNPGGSTFAAMSSSYGSSEITNNANQSIIGGTNSKWFTINTVGMMVSNDKTKFATTATLEVEGNAIITTVNDGSDEGEKFLYQAPNGEIKKKAVIIGVSTQNELIAALSNDNIDVININKSFVISGLTYGSTVLGVNTDKVIQGFPLIFGDDSSIFFESNQPIEIKVYCDLIVKTIFGVKDATFGQNPNATPSGSTFTFFRNIFNDSFLVTGLNSVYEFATTPSAVEAQPAGSAAPQQFWDNTAREKLNDKINESTVSSDTEKGGLFFKDDVSSSTLTISNTPI